MRIKKLSIYLLIALAALCKLSSGAQISSLNTNLYQVSDSIKAIVQSNLDLYQELNGVVTEDSLEQIKATILGYLDEIYLSDRDKLSNLQLTDQEIIEGNNRVLQLIERVIKANNQLLDDCNSIVNYLPLKTDPDTVRVWVSSFYNNHGVLQVGFMVLKDLKGKSEIPLELKEEPINVERIGNYYNTSKEIVRTLFVGAGKKSDKKESKEKPKVVVKGYSPFTDYYNEFVFVTDSSEKDNDKKTDESNSDGGSKKETTEVGEKSGVVSITTDFNSDTVNQITLKDSINVKKRSSVPSPQLISTKQSFKSIDTTATENVNDGNILTSKTEKSIVAPTVLGYDDTKTKYFVQVAACRKPMSKQLLNSLYSGLHSVTVRQEGGWYKYQLLGIEDYAKAIEIKKELKVSGSFVVAYKNDVKQILWKTLKRKNNVDSSSGLRFYVQISANKKQMGAQQKKNLELKYNSGIRLIEEGGWYKYQLQAGDSYSEAVEKRKVVGESVSFIVAYHNGDKIKLSKAIGMSNAKKVR